MPDLLIPVRTFEKSPGAFELPKKLAVAPQREADRLVAEQLAADLKTRKHTARIGPGDPSAAIRMHRDKHRGCPEAYTLIIGKDGVELIGATSAGLYYAGQTLRQLIRLHGSKLPCGRITDWPAFTRRGIYLDCSRGKVPKVSTVKRLIEQLAHWKINELMLYCENTIAYESHPDIGEGFSPFKPKDLVEIQRHCKLHHMRFVPSLPSLGHMEKILMLPAYTELGEMPGYRDLPGGTTLNPTDKRSIALLDDLYGELFPVIEAEDVHVSGDEPWELGKGRSKTKAEREGLGRVYLDFMLKVRDICLRHDKRMNMWGDILLNHPEVIPELPADVVACNWQYTVNNPKGRIPRTHLFRQAGLPLVCCPGTNNWQSHGSRMQTATDNVSVFAGVALENDAEGLVHTEWGDFGHRNTLATALYSFSHAAAHAWHHEGVDDKTHLERFAFHTFGDDGGALAKALRVLGDDKSWAWSYHALIYSLADPEKAFGTFYWPGFGMRLDEVELDDAYVRKHIAELESTELLDPATVDDPFLSTMLEEMALARWMEELAWKRLPMFRTIQAGKPVPADRLNEHADGMDAMTREFARMWKKVNRPSRMKDNTQAMKAAAKEARKLAKG